MEALRVDPSPALGGRRAVPGDKSISHRALLFGSLARGDTRIRGLLDAEDVGRTRKACVQLGVEVVDGVDAEGAFVEVRGTGGWTGEAGSVDCGNSGTTARLLLGALAGRSGATLHGDASLSRRPMRRVRAPLEAMGARFVGGDTLPLRVEAAPLRGVDWLARVASAQVKSAVLLAGMVADGETIYREPVGTRDHTERMLRAMGARLTEEAAGEGAVLTVRSGSLEAVPLRVPGDLSSAAFLLGAAALVPGSDVWVDGVGLNPTRTGFLDALVAMGVDVQVEDRGGFEPLGTVRVRGGPIRGVTLSGALIPRLIDELPLLAVLGAFAEGETHIRDAAELRVKESDRIASVAAGLRAMGAEVEERPDGLSIAGGARLHAEEIASGGDHRIAMAFAVGGLRTGMRIGDVACIRTSFPSFVGDLQSIGASIGPA